MNQNVRYALLAGTMLLPTFAAPQAGMAADSASVGSDERPMMLAQAPAIDPATGKPYPKGAPPKGAVPPPKAPPAAAAPPPPPGPPPGAPKIGVQPKAVQPLQGAITPGGPPAGAGGPPPGPPPGAPKIGVQPKAVQPLQGAVTPSGPPPAGAGGPPPGPPPGAPKIGVQPKAVQPLQGAVTPGGPPPAGAGGPPPGPPPGAPKIGVQPKAIQPLQGAVTPGAPPAGAGMPPAGAPKVGVQPAPVQPLQGAVSPGGPPKIFTPGPQGHPTAVMTGNVDLLRKERHERREGGAVIIQEPGNRLIVREGGRAFVRHDETQRFRLWGEPRMERRGNEQFAVVTRPGGYQIITVTDGSGRLLRRMRRGPDGREVVLLQNRYGAGAAVVGVGLAAGVILALAAPRITIPRERYIVDASVAPAPLLYETLDAPPVEAIERPYTIDEIRFNVALRDRMRRIDIDSITFDSGSWEVGPEQQPKLQALAEAMQQILSQRPDEMFLIEGHTDAVGADVDNLSLSDRRAESVAVVLTSVYQIPPENLVSQGYGEQFLKVPTDGPSRENRRVAGRRITPLLNGGVAAQ